MNAANNNPGRADRALKEPTRMKWLKAMYLANIVIAAPLGVGALVTPGAIRAIMGVPPGDPVSYGIAVGAVPLAFGLAGIAGLRAPLRVAPVLALQALYKSLFLVAVIAPLALAGQLPGHALPLIVMFVFFIVGAIVVVPFPYLLSRESGAQGASHGGKPQGEEGAVERSVGPGELHP